jgi:hypothetical protein
MPNPCILQWQNGVGQDYPWIWILLAVPVAKALYCRSVSTTPPLPSAHARQPHLIPCMSLIIIITVIQRNQDTTCFPWTPLQGCGWTKTRAPLSYGYFLPYLLYYNSMKLSISLLIVMKTSQINQNGQIRQASPQNSMPATRKRTRWPCTQPMSDLLNTTKRARASQKRTQPDLRKK